MQIFRFLKKLFLLLPILFAMVAVNYFVDPTCVFKGERFYKDMARIMLSGRNIANLAEHDDRLLYKYYIGGLRTKKDILAFGSSRVLLVDSGLFPGHSFFNNGVIRGCSIEDHMALYWMYHKKGLIPSFAVLELDPWLLDEHNKFTGYLSIIKEYNEAMTYLCGKSDRSDLAVVSAKGNVSKFAQLFSPNYFQLSFWRWMNYPNADKWKGVVYYPTSTFLGKEKIKHSDGSFGYEQAFREIGTAESYRLARAESGYAFDDLGRSCEDKLERLIDLMQEDGVRLVIFLPEYNPVLYDKLRASGRIKGISGAERYYRALAARKKIRVIGSFDPKARGLGASDFYDGLHAKVHVIKRTFMKGIGVFAK